MGVASAFTVHRVAICGVGLIGGSIALDLQMRRGRTPDLIAFDRAHILASLRRDKRFRIQTESRLSEAVRGADIVILASPLAANQKLLERLGRMKNLADTLIIDTGAVKEPISSLGQTLEFAPGTQFLPTHPMAGREGSGAVHARVGLFQGRPWFVDERVRLNRANAARWHWFVSRVDAQPVQIDAALHDALIAELSHLPQLLSTLLGAQLSPETLPLAGPGLASMLRLAGSPWHTWSEIVDENRENILQIMELFSLNLSTMIAMLRRGESLKEIFASAARSYRCLS